MKLSSYCRGKIRIENFEMTYNFPMKTTMNLEMGTKIAKLLILVAAVYLGMKYIVPIVLPFFVGLILARFLYPLAQMLEKKTSLGKMMSRSVTYVIFLAVVGGIVIGILYICYRMGSNCLNDLTYFIENMKNIFGRCCDRLEEMSRFSTEAIKRTVNEEVADLTGGAMKYSKDAGGYVLSLVAKVFVTFVATLLILNDYEKITGELKKTRAGRRIVDMLLDMKKASGAYLKAQLCIIALVIVVCVVGLLLLRIPNALWIGIAIGLCDALPFLGTGTVFVPWALIEILLGGYGKVAGFLGLYLICSFIRQILEPRFVGQRLGVPPLVVLMSIYIGIQVYGAGGVILGPVSALILYEVYKKSSIEHIF